MPLPSNTLASMKDWTPAEWGTFTAICLVPTLAAFGALWAKIVTATKEIRESLNKVDDKANVATTMANVAQATAVSNSASLNRISEGLHSSQSKLVDLAAQLPPMPGTNRTDIPSTTPTGIVGNNLTPLLGMVLAMMSVLVMGTGCGSKLQQVTQARQTYTVTLAAVDRSYELGLIPDKVFVNDIEPVRQEAKTLLDELDALAVAGKWIDYDFAMGKFNTALDRLIAWRIKTQKKS